MLKWMFVVEFRQQTLAWMVVVEVWQGTLSVGGRGEDEEEEKDEEEEAEEAEEATNIKSNNPHLAGGEQTGSGKCLPHIRLLEQWTAASD